MKIAFECPNCSRSYEVDAANAGRKGRCKACGGVMTVPEAAVTDDYAMVEPVARPMAWSPPGEEPEGATFQARPEANPKRKKKSLKKKLVRQAKEEASDLAAALAAHWRWLVGVPAAGALVCWLIATFIPNGVLVVACILAVIGIAMLATGFFVGAYGAFHEDFLNGMLYLFIPFYTAYFIATNWDAMWRWALLMGGGVTLITIASGLALPRLEEMSKAKSDQALLAPGAGLVGRPSPVFAYAGF